MAADRLLFPRLRPLALAVLAALLPGFAAQAQAQASAGSQPPPGSPSDVRYTAPTAGQALLHPRSPDQDDARPTALRGDGREGPGYAANAVVGRIVVEVNRNAVPADGQSPVELTLRLFGRDGQPLKGPVLATLEHSGGRVLLPGARTDEFGPRRQDADRTLRGVQVRVDNGLARFTLLAPAEAQDVRVRITAGDQEASGAISFVPDLRPMIAAGLIEGIVSFRNKVGLQPVRRGDAFERELESWSRDFSNGRGTVAARAAFYLKGTIRGDLLLTAAYDSDRDTRARLLRDVRPDELYPVYGDASLRSFDARSTERLYVRLDKGKSYALFGDFVTGDGFSQPIGQGAVASLKQRSLGQYNRSATGVRLHHEAGNLVGNVFAFRDTLKQVLEEFASQGSGPYGLSNNGVLEGSEKIEVLVRDRNQPSRILSVRPLQRLVDYSFEPFSGRILLATFLPSIDADLNPVTLRVTYEVDQGGTPFWVVGGDAQWRLSEGFEIGGSRVKDRNALAPYDLASGNLTWRIGERTALVIEGAQSTSTVNTNPTNTSTSPALAGRRGEVQGKAARVELAHEGDRSDARVYWGRSSPLFNNASAPLAGGREEWLLQGGFKVLPSVRVYGHALKSEDRNSGGGDRQQAALGLNWKLSDRLTLDASLRRATETVGTQGNGALTWPFDQTAGLSGSIASGSGGGALGFGSQLLDPATGLPVIGQRGLQAGRSTLAAGTRLESTTLRLGAGFRVNNRVTLGGEIEGDVSGDDRRRAAVGADYLIAERTKVYGRYERQSGWVQLGGVSDRGRSAGAFALGIESSYFRDTQAFSEYRLRDAVAGRDLQLASGIRNQWDLAEGWRLNTGFEHLASIRGNTPGTRAISAGLDWSAHPLWRASGRVELRTSGDAPDTAENDRFNTLLLQGLLARKLDRDWTLLARNHTLRTDYAARGDVLQNRAQVGLAYRDTDTNRVNALAKLEYKLENDASNASNASVGELKSRAWIASTHADWHPVRPWWLTGRVAAKWQKDRFENGVASDFKAMLLAGRLVWDMTENWDLSVLSATQIGQRGARDYAVGAEVGYLLRQNLWLSVGVNATGFAGDADLVGYEYTRSGVYIRLRFKFDENLFKGSDREVNRSLPR
ncbi:MAG: hypothetical protein LW768_07040 [Rubrivivax sp.]|jgi:hypothetical protein|nr:hypothetical protein [Rubrivivax sp.]